MPGFEQNVAPQVRHRRRRFNQPDVLYWIENEPAFTKQTVFLDDADTPGALPSAAELSALQCRLMLD